MSAKKNYWTLKIIPKEEYVTNPIATRYEIAKLLSCVADYIIQNPGNNHVNVEDLYISTDRISPEDLLAIKSEDVHNRDGQSYIKLTDTESIAKFMINKKIVPFTIIREIGRSDQEKIIYAEEWDVNDLFIEPFSLP